MDKRFLEELKVNAMWQQTIAEIKTHRPLCPQWNHEDDNTDEWKARSNQQKGFDLVLTLLGEKHD